MTVAHPPVRFEGDDLWVIVHAQPGARHSSFAGAHGEAVKIRLAAPPQAVRRATGSQRVRQ